MKKDLQRTITLPEGMNAEITDESITLNKGTEKNTKKLHNKKVMITKKGNEIILEAKNATRRESKTIGTLEAHIKNMIKGLEEGFEYQMEICNVHFPMNVKIEGEKIIIKSFLGETTQRTARIMKGTTVDIKGTNITIKAKDIEAAGQTAANIEKAARLTGRDRRIFQDGIFITEKNGRTI
jgi:large subunit ribosomal protein L6